MNFSKKTEIISIIVLLIILITWLIIHESTPKKNKLHALNTIITVRAEKIIAKPTPIETILPGTIEPVESVDVRSQITGILKKITFKPGKSVKSNELLFQLASDSFVAALENAQANLQKDQAQYDEIKKNLKRSAILLKKNYVSRQSVSELRSQLKMQSATILSDQDAVKTAQLQLSYTNITAPIDGKTGNVSVKMGDLISANSTDPLVTINKINPVNVDFSLPQNQLSQLLFYKHLHKISNRISVEVWNENQTKLFGKGNLIFVDNTINSQTGTILLKALIPNKQELLWPSQLVIVKLIFTILPNTLVIPTSAVHVDNTGQFVYVIQNGKAVVTRINIAREVGKHSVIQSGLNQGDLIITSAPPNLQNGDAVSAR